MQEGWYIVPLSRKEKGKNFYLLKLVDFEKRKNDRYISKAKEGYEIIIRKEDFMSIVELKMPEERKNEYRDASYVHSAIGRERFKEILDLLFG